MCIRSSCRRCVSSTRNEWTCISTHKLCNINMMLQRGHHLITAVATTFLNTLSMTTRRRGTPLYCRHVCSKEWHSTDKKCTQHNIFIAQASSYKFRKISRTHNVCTYIMYRLYIMYWHEKLATIGLINVLFTAIWMTNIWIMYVYVHFYNPFISGYSVIFLINKKTLMLLLSYLANRQPQRESTDKAVLTYLPDTDW